LDFETVRPQAEFAPRHRLRKDVDRRQVLRWAQAVADQLRALADDDWPRFNVFLQSAYRRSLPRTLVEPDAADSADDHLE
jgi:hypothetical protein